MVFDLMAYLIYTDAWFGYGVREWEICCRSSPTGGYGFENEGEQRSAVAVRPFS